MHFVVTLIAPATDSLDAAIVGDVRTALNALGAETATPDWLAETACDVGFDDISADQGEAAARQAVGGAPIDVIAQATEDRRKALLLADMDSTIVTGETLDELAAFAGLKDRIAEITAKAMNGELDFAQALRERVGMLAGLDAGTLDEAWKLVRLSPGAKTLVRTMADHGARCILISGGFKYFTSRVASLCGFHEDYSNDFVIEDGTLTGAVVEPILNKDAKLRTLIERASAESLPLSKTLTVGDGANDLPMLKAAGLGVAYRGKPSVREEAPARLDHGDLTGLLFAQGYRAQEFSG